MNDVRVLIVGAGPTGLTAAIELARRGIGVRIVDRAVQPNTQTRALGVQARTLELLERSGVTAELLARGLRASRFNVLSEGKQILRADFEGLPSPYPFLLMVPQNEVEEVLTQRLADLGVAIERTVELTSLQAAPEHAAVTLEHGDGRVEEATYDWVIGADGAHSAVRKQLGIGFVGTAFDEAFAVADLKIGWDRPADEFFAFLNRGRFAAFFPMPGGWHRVAIAQPTATHGDEDPAPLQTAELQGAIDHTVPGEPQIVEVRQAGRFRINQRRAAAHRVERVFLTGDAAHIHSVIGAQGMNTGIQDAINLGWKLAAVIEGDADAQLLDSYADERAPVAARLVKATRRVTRLTLVGSAVGTAARRTLAPRILGRARARDTLVRAIAQLDVSYHDASATSEHGQVRVGDRAPDAAIALGHDAPTVFDRLHPSGFTLIHVTASSDGESATQVPARLVEHLPEASAVLHVPAGTDAGSVYGGGSPSWVLIRPDGYVAARGSDADITAYLQQYRDDGAVIAAGGRG